MTSTYEHTQCGWLHYITYAAAAVFIFIAGMTWFSHPVFWFPYMYFAVGLLMLGISACFHCLTVRDEGDHLAVRFGPLPLFRKLIPYAEVTSAEPDRTTFIDGWGIHWVPGRGTIYNVAGFACVRLQLGNKTIRIGSDDAGSLVAFLRTRIKPLSH